MKKRARILSCLLTLTMAAGMTLGGCGSEQKPAENTSAQEETKEEQQEPAAGDVAEEAADDSIHERPADGDYIELALNVYYNDSDSNYYANEVSSVPIFVTEEGQYTVDFDCDRDLSQEAKGLGVMYLKNLTAIYIKDSGIAAGERSPLSAANIMYDEITVDGTALTITQTGPKSAFKNNGDFDTNDPINAWDGSVVEEIDADTTNHVANISAVENPKTISVTFTLTDMVWGDAGTAQASSAGDFVYAVTDYTDLSTLSALEASKLMGNGINLGNTMEAYGHTTIGISADVSSYETCWGQPVTTADMIKGYRASGFDTIRIPVSWTNKMDYESGDYTISADYLDRVQEIVDYCIDAGLFVIVNDHWDGGWFAMFGSSNEDTRAAAMEMYTQMWQQIADRFKDYPDNLILESANEELGNGLNNNSVWADSGSLSKDEEYSVANAINQKFVDVVRASGGNNDDRFLLIAGINTNFDNTIDDRFVMPTDTAKDKLLLSVHYYDPWDYCGDKDSDASNKHWGTVKEYEYMADQFEKLTKFTDQGYGVIIGEYGALKMSADELMYNTIEYHSNLLDLCDTYNYVPVLWDTNMFYDKSACTLRDQEVLDLYLSRTYAKEQEMGEEAYLAAVKTHMEEAAEAAPESFNEGGAVEVDSETMYAWIMWNGGAGSYSVGDVYNPNADHPGIIPTDVVVDGEGTYTVGLEFEGGNDGLTFGALAVSNAEVKYPGCILNIKEILVNGEPIHMIAEPYTSSDDGLCTRVNLINEWVGSIPDDARTMSNGLSNASSVIIDKQDLVGVNTITITFDFVVK